MTDTTETATNTGVSTAFAFGDPEPVLDNRLMGNYLGVFVDSIGDYYRPPVDLMGLANLIGANSYHGPILHFKKNCIVKWYEPTPLLSSATLKQCALDFVVTGNAYLQKFYDRFGRVVRLGWLPALTLRRGKQPGVFFQLTPSGGHIEFKPGEVIQPREPDIKQAIYGVPQYLGGIQSVLLSEESTLFRRKFMLNGAHVGYILVTTDANLDEATAKAIEKQIKDSKGPGNFRSLYLNIARSSSREPVKIIPVGNIGSKDEFQAIKEVTEMEMLAMHRVYPGLASIIPANIGGFGDLQKSMEVYHEMEIMALQQVFLEVNEVVGVEVVRFRAPDWKTLPAVA